MIVKLDRELKTRLQRLVGAGDMSRVIRELITKYVDSGETKKWRKKS